MAMIIVNIICRMIENLAMIAGVVYSAVYFKKLAVLWFLLLSAINIYRLEWQTVSANPDEEETEEEK